MIFAIVVRFFGLMSMSLQQPKTQQRHDVYLNAIMMFRLVAYLSVLLHSIQSMCGNLMFTR